MANLKNIEIIFSYEFDWNIPTWIIILSEKDTIHPKLNDLDSMFIDSFFFIDLIGNGKIW